MASIFSNLDIIAKNKGAAQKIMGVDPGLGNAHKDMKLDSSESGKNSNDAIFNINNNNSSSNKQQQKEMQLSNKEFAKPQDPASEAGSKFPMKKDLNKDSRMKESPDSPKTEVKLNEKTYQGRVETYDKPPQKDKTKTEFMDSMQSDMDDNTKYQKMPPEGNYKRKNEEGKVEKPENLIGEGPMVKREQTDINMGKMVTKDPAYPNASIPEYSSRPTGQVETPKFPMNNISSSVGGAKMPNTIMPSFKFPKG
jgi:hypothetical protein